MNYCLIGSTMLIWAAIYGRLPAVEKLINNGADINKQSNYGKYLYFFVLKGGNIEHIYC